MIRGFLYQLRLWCEVYKRLKKMLAKGLMVTINSDDPAYFGGYINENYRAVADALDLSRSDLAGLARNSLNAAFIDSSEKQALIARLESYLSATGLS